MNILLVEQSSAVALFTESAWNKHIQWVRMTFLQEMEPEEAEELVTDYKSQFKETLINEVEAKKIEKNLHLKINEGKDFNSYSGDLIRF